MSVFSIIVLLICAIGCYVSDTNSSNSCKTFQINKNYLNKRLSVVGIAEKSKPGLHDCVKSCFYFSVCKSFDFNTRSNMCKLNYVNSSEVTDSDFENQTGAIFSDITAWPATMAGACGSRPCSVLDKCVPGKETYQCEEFTGCLLDYKAWLALRSTKIYVPGLPTSHSDASSTCDRYDSYLADVTEQWKRDTIVAALKHCKGPFVGTFWVGESEHSAPSSHETNCTLMVRDEGDLAGDFRLEEGDCNGVHRFICETLRT